MKVIVITGASDGIGAEMARQWAARGQRRRRAGARGAQRRQARGGRRSAAEPAARRCSCSAATSACEADCIGADRCRRRRPSAASTRWSTTPACRPTRCFDEVDRPALVRDADAHQPLGQRLVHPRRAAAPEGQRAAASSRWRALAGLVGVPGPHGLQRHQVRDDRLLRGAAGRAAAQRRQRDDRLPGRGRHRDPPPRLQRRTGSRPARAASTKAAR